MNNTRRESADHDGCTQQPPVVNGLSAGVGVKVGVGVGVMVGVAVGVDVLIGVTVAVDEGTGVGVGAGVVGVHEHISATDASNNSKSANPVFIVFSSNRAARARQNC